MARPSTGSIVERAGKTGATFGLRFRAGGRREYVTTKATTRAEAEFELANLLADVRRGLWKPPVKSVAPAVVVEPSFHEFASEWLAARALEGLAAKTITDLRWSLSNHLLPHFADYLLSAITAQEIDVGRSARRRNVKSSTAPGHVVRRASTGVSLTTRSTMC